MPSSNLTYFPIPSNFALLTNRLRMSHIRMAILLNFPPDLCRIVCSEWLVDKDLIKLDCAVCMKSMRPTLLSTLSSMLPFRSNSLFTFNYLKWIAGRQLKLLNFHLHGEVIENYEKLCALNTDFVDELVVSFSQQIDVVRVMNTYRTLSSLEIDATLVCKMSADILRQLKCLTVKSNSFTLAFHCDELLHCLNLRHISLLSSPSTEFVFRKNKILLISLIMQNPRLEVIELTADIEVLNTIVDHCNALRSVTIVAFSVEFLIVARALECANLTQLNVSDGNGSKVHYSIDAVTGCKDLTLYDYNNLNGKTELFSSVSGLHRLNTEGPIRDPDVSVVVSHSMTTLTSLVISRAKHLTHVSLVDILKCSAIHTIVLGDISIEDDLILNAFLDAPPVHWRKMSLRTRGISSRTVFAILRLCTSLNKAQFTGVEEDQTEVSNLVHFLRNVEGSHSHNVLDCDIEFRYGAGGLYFSNGIFGGTNVNKYLTEREKESNLYYNSDENDS